MIFSKSWNKFLTTYEAGNILGEQLGYFENLACLQKPTLDNKVDYNSFKINLSRTNVNQVKWRYFNYLARALEASLAPDSWRAASLRLPTRPASKDEGSRR